MGVNGRPVAFVSHLSRIVASRQKASAGADCRQICLQLLLADEEMSVDVISAKKLGIRK